MGEAAAAKAAAPAPLALLKARDTFPRGPLGTALLYVAFAYIACSLLLCFLLTLLSQLVCIVLLAPLIIGSTRFRMDILGRCIRYWCTVMGVWLNPFWTVKVVRQPPKGYRPSGTIVMCNHVSAADAWVVCAATFPWELKYVFKASMYKLPIAGWAIRLGYDIPIYFTKEKGGWGTEKGSVAEMMEYVAELISKGFSLSIFPEGTRSRTGRMQLFKDGFFRFALEHGCEILPCAHHGTPTLWPRGSSLFGCGTAHFAFGDPIKVTPGMCSVEELKTRVRSEMAELLKCCPNYDESLESPVDEMPTSRGQGIRGGATLLSRD